MRGGTVQINWHDLQPVLTLDFHPVSRRLATGGGDHDIKIWAIASDDLDKKLPTASYLSSLSSHSSAVNVLRFSPSVWLCVINPIFPTGYMQEKIWRPVLMTTPNLSSRSPNASRTKRLTVLSGRHNPSIFVTGGGIILWKLHINDDGSEAWKVHKSLLFHRKDVLDLQWSSDGSFLVSASVDNSCIIWDANKGAVQQMLEGHLHYVQGVAWDPLGQYIASLSSDRTCKIYANKPQGKSKNMEKMNFVCQHTLVKAELQSHDDSKPTVKTHLFHDETLPSFFRRLAWSPDGSFLVLPAGQCKYSSEVVNTAYIMSRRDLSRPAIQLPGASKAIVAVRFCPVLFSLRGSQSEGLFKLPYRAVFAVATFNSLYVYDTESAAPILIHAGLHYAAITDIAWSSDAKYLALSSRDGYCTIIEFENEELGQPHIVSGKKEVTEANVTCRNTKPLTVDSMEVDFGTSEVKMSACPTDTMTTPPVLAKNSTLGIKEATERTATCGHAEPLKADSMEVDVGASKAKMEANPVSVEVTPPPVSAKKSASRVKEVTEGTATCEDAKPLKADSMEVDVGASKAKTEANPASVEVTPPPVSTKKSASSKPTKKRITPIAIN
ncbi:hypothetical protein ACQ4PT_032600 [Festuca glaucescens]